MHNGADSRLTTEFLSTAFMPALNIVERDWRDAWRAKQTGKDRGAPGALIIVGNKSQDKFFSNGVYPGLPPLHPTHAEVCFPSQALTTRMPSKIPSSSKVRVPCGLLRALNSRACEQTTSTLCSVAC